MVIDPGWIALAGTVLGGTGLKAIEHFLNKGQVKTNEATRIREELREQIDNQRGEIRKLEKEVDEWRSKYYDLRDTHIKLQTEMMIGLQRLKDGFNNESTTEK